MQQEPLFFTILDILEVAVLQRVGAKQYAIYGKPPAFYTKNFPSVDGMPCSAPWHYSAMLEFFLNNAEHFFAHHTTGEISSGLWQEQGLEEDNALLATATCANGHQLLLIRHMHEVYLHRLMVLQKARDQVLERRKLRNDLEMYKQKSRVDSLTTLFNRGTFTECLDEEMRVANADDTDLSLLLLDIDDFKKINDTYGHLAGDSVLRAFGALLRSTLRGQDLPVRYGGEEFAILCSGTNQTQALRLAEKLRVAIMRHSFPPLKTVTASIGCTQYAWGECADTFIQRADLALYDAKSNGKNTVNFR